MATSANGDGSAEQGDALRRWAEASEPFLKALGAALDADPEGAAARDRWLAYLEAATTIAQKLETGAISRAQALETLEPLWRAASDPASRAAIDRAYAVVGPAPLPAWDALTARYGPSLRERDWAILGDRYGASAFVDGSSARRWIWDVTDLWGRHRKVRYEVDAPDAPADPPGLPMPRTDCSAPPLTVQETLDVADGIGTTARVAADPATGTASASVGTGVALWGVRRAPLVGVDVPIPPGFRTVRATATLDMSFTLEAVSGLGVAMAAAEAKQLLRFDSGETAEDGVALAILRPPALRDARAAISGQSTSILGAPVTIPGSATALRLIAGPRATAEAYGTGRATATVSATVQRLCLTFET